MSGPKIVRIVTREEVITICEGLLAQLDDSIQRWRSTGDRQGLIRQDDIAEVLRRREKIQRLLDGDRLVDLQKQVPQEMAFLQSDLERRVSDKAAVEADERTGRRRVASAAASLLASLDSERVTVPSELRQALEDAKANARRGLKAAEQAIARSLAIMVPERAEQTLSERQMELAAKLGDGDRIVTLTEWLAGRPPPDDDLGRKLDAYIASLETAEGPAVAAPYAARADAIASEPSAQRRRLLADSLIVELARDAAGRKERARVIDNLSALCAEVGGLRSPGGGALVARMESAKQSGDLRELRQLTEEARHWLDSERKATAAVARRNAVLAALSQLGYEVREGMSTAWVENNRIVLRKSAAPDYGLEVSGKTETGRLQFRVVGSSAPSQPRSTSRDRDMEVIWCSEMEELRALLAAGGGELVIERATPAGEQPLKDVQMPLAVVQDGRSIETPSSIARTTR